MPAELDEAGLEALMYRKPAPPERYAQPDYAVIHQELSNLSNLSNSPNVSRALNALNAPNVPNVLNVLNARITASAR